MIGRLHLIGPVRALDRQLRPITLAGERTREILAAIALEQGNAISREKLAARIWGSDGPEARKALNSALWRLRNCLREHGCEGWITGDGDYLRLDPVSGPELDIEDFWQAVRRSDTVDLDSAQLVAFLGYAEGELADDVASEWLEDYRRNHVETFVNTAGALCDRLGSGAPSPQLVEVAQRLTRIDPFDERGWRVLIQYHIAHGNSTQALRRYGELSDILGRELGVEPARATRRLLQVAGLLGAAGGNGGGENSVPASAMGECGNAASLSLRIGDVSRRISLLQDELNEISGILASLRL